MRTLLVLPLALSLTAAAVGAPPANDDATRIQGNWKIVAGKDQGNPLAAPKIEGDEVRITKNTITINDTKRKHTWTMKYELLPREHQINMVMVNGPDKGKEALGIYELRGDALKITYALPGFPRPRSFTSTKSDHHLTFVMERGTRRP